MPVSRILFPGFIRGEDHSSTRFTQRDSAEQAYLLRKAEKSSFYITLLRTGFFPLGIAAPRRELLPRVFTLASPDFWRGGMVFCDTFPRRESGSPCRGLPNAGAPPLSDCPALRSSDFPPSRGSERAIFRHPSNIFFQRAKIQSPARFSAMLASRSARLLPGWEERGMWLTDTNLKSFSSSRIFIMRARSPSCLIL